MSNITALYDAPDTPSPLTRPLFLTWVAAGSPSPADDHLDRDLDLHELLIQHPAATYYVRLAGDSMQGVGLYDGDGVSANLLHGCGRFMALGRMALS